MVLGLVSVLLVAGGSGIDSLTCRVSSPPLSASMNVARDRFHEQRVVCRLDSRRTPDMTVICWNCGAPADAEQAECNICKAGLRPLDPGGVGLGASKPAAVAERFFCVDCNVVTSFRDGHESKGHSVRAAATLGSSGGTGEVDAADGEASHEQVPSIGGTEPQPLMIVSKPEIRSLRPLDAGHVVTVSLDSQPPELWVEVFRAESPNVGITFSASDLSFYIPVDAEVRPQLNDLSEAIERTNRIYHDRWVGEQDHLARTRVAVEAETDPATRAVDDWWDETGLIRDGQAATLTGNQDESAASRESRVAMPTPRTTAILGRDWEGDTDERVRCLTDAKHAWFPAEQETHANHRVVAIDRTRPPARQPTQRELAGNQSARKTIHRWDWKRIANFRSRARRSEFCASLGIWASTFLGLWMIAVYQPELLEGESSLFVTVAWLALGIWLSVGAQVNRLHDLGYSGLWVLLSGIPFVGVGMMIWLAVASGQPGPNEWGPPVA